LNVDDVTVCGFGTALADDEGLPRPLRAGERLRISVDIDNQLVPGRYSVLCTVSRSGAPGDYVLHDLRITDFLVTGADPIPGMIVVEPRVQATVEGGASVAAR
jgi:hypothetical protein